MSDEILTDALLDKYRIVLETRNFEIRMFWQRSNYFLVLNTALGTGFFVVHGKGFALLLCILGVVASALWLCVNLGSKFWQVRWEQQLDDEEQRSGFPADMKLFSTERDDLDDIVERGLAKTPRWRLDRRLWYRGVLVKPSVTLMMTYLSCSFVLVWLVAFIRKLTLLCQ